MERSCQAGRFSCSAGTKFTVSCLSGSARSSVQPCLHSSLPELLTSFSGFQQVIHQPEPAHMVWNNLSYLLPWPPSLSAALSAQLLRARWLACPLFLIYWGQFTIYSHSFEDFALSYRDLLHKLHSPPAQMPHMPPFQTSQLSHQCLGHVRAPKQAVYGCCDSNIYLFPLQESLILSYNSNLMSHLPPFPEQMGPLNVTIRVSVHTYAIAVAGYPRLPHIRVAVHPPSFFLLTLDLHSPPVLQRLHTSPVLLFIWWQIFQCAHTITFLEW